MKQFFSSIMIKEYAPSPVRAFIVSTKIEFDKVINPNNFTLKIESYISENLKPFTESILTGCTGKPNKHSQNKSDETHHAGVLKTSSFCFAFTVD